MENRDFHYSLVTRPCGCRFLVCDPDKKRHETLKGWARENPCKSCSPALTTRFYKDESGIDRRVEVEISGSFEKQTKHYPGEVPDVEITSNPHGICEDIIRQDVLEELKEYRAMTPAERRFK